MFRNGCVYVLAVASVAVSVGRDGAAAQTLIDGLSAPAIRAAALGNWSPKPGRTPKADPWKASITSAGKAVAPAKAARGSALAERPYGLRGPLIEGNDRSLRGFASFYVESAELTAAGEHFDAKAMTAAHPTLPFGTKVRVTRLDTGDSVVVRINDRGPFKRGRIIDLTQGAAENLKMTTAGLTEVRLDVLDRERQ